MSQVEVIADYACVVGEGPLWHPLEKRLYWSDIPGGKMFRYDPASGVHEQFYEGPQVGGFTVQADGALLLFRDRGNIVIYAGGKVVRTIVEEVPQEANLAGGRWNDVIADPQGRVFCGTLSEGGGGRLYRLDTDGTLTKLVHGLTVCNGLGFTPDRSQLYFTDTSTFTIWRFDYDQADGSLSNQTLWSKTPEDGGWPDGLTVDSKGNVWSARWGGAGVVCLSPEGRQIGKIETPTARQVSSVTFAGDDYSQMYLTTAGGGEKSAAEPDAGALLRVDPGVRGVAEFYSRVGLA